MGLKETNKGDVGDGEGGGGEGKECSLSLSKNVLCSICLEPVTDVGERSWAKLQCGHEFHLDCIGSAFNMKGAMQCPNCRKIEKGQWNYANVSRLFTDYTEDWPNDEDAYDLNYTEMFGVQWCPIPGFSRIPSFEYPFEEVDFSPTTYQDLTGHHTLFAEQTAVSSTTQQCPYVPAYYGPLHSSSSNSGASVSEGPNFSNRWGGPPGQNEVQQTSYGFPAMEPRYVSWEHHSVPFIATNSQLGASDQPSIPFVNQRSTRANADLSQSGSFVHPFVTSHRSGNRVGSSMTSSMVPPYPGSAARTRDRVQALQAYFQPPNTSPPIPMFFGNRRSNVPRGVSQVGPPPSSSRNFPEAENTSESQFHGWERGHNQSQHERDSTWTLFPRPTSGGGLNGGRQRSPPRGRSRG